MDNYYKKFKVIQVTQPLGSFFVASIKARDLLALTYSVPAKLDEDSSSLVGTQRLEKPERLREIADYIRTHDAAFPNSIIIGANYDDMGRSEVDQENTDDEKKRLDWHVVEDGSGGLDLIIPSDKKLGSIIDGQHRLHAFELCSDEYKNIELLCSIYIDLPVPYHAFLFSTINFNQRKVDKSLAYNLFGFDIESSEPETWVPETLAVSIARQLNFEPSPFQGKISLGIRPKQKFRSWKVSMATVVDGILKLISKKPKYDRHALFTIKQEIRDRSSLETDSSPLRILYLGSYDEAIKEIICNYFNVIDELIWMESDPDSYITKTVGVQALFDVLVVLLKDFERNQSGDKEYFLARLEKIKGMKFEDAQASGIGRTFIRNKILEAIGEK